MQITPTWDLIIIVIFITVVAYSFVVRASGTMKMILSTYVGIIAADGIGDLIFKHFAGPNPTLRLFSIAGSEDTIIGCKITAFVLIIVFMALKGAFDSNLAEESGGFVNMGITALLGILNAGLIVSAVLVYMAGGSFLPGIDYVATDIALSMYDNSVLAQVMVNYASLWFSVPALALIATSMLTE